MCATANMQLQQKPSSIEICTVYEEEEEMWTSMLL